MVDAFNPLDYHRVAMTKTIPAANNPSIHYTVDDVDYDYLAQYRWDANDHGYASCRKMNRSMHKEVAARMGLAGRIDHENRDPTDNRRNNLRVATASQNAANQGPTARNTTGYKGVQWQHNRWIAMIGIDYGNSWIGSFDSAEEAAVAYDLKARKLYGEFAYVNIPCPSQVLVDRVHARLASAKPRKGTSIYYGVTRHRGKWRGRIAYQGCIYDLGCFTEEMEAAQTVDAQLDRLNSPHKRNFPKTIITL